MKIKICGLKRKEDVDYVNLYKPDYVGFVFAGTRRKIDLNTAKILRKRLSKDIMAVGVFVNEEVDNIINLVDLSVIQLIQLHGDENEEYIAELKNRLAGIGKAEIPVIKGVRVRERLQVLEADRLPVDYLLLDAFSEDEYGGSGKCFNHDLIPEIQTPYMLAGGIGSDNVNKIIEKIKEKSITLPIGIDVSSSVETEGVKDSEKIRNMISSVRNIRI